MGTHPSRLLRSIGAAALLALGVAGCREPAQPSEDFTHAHARFAQLYAQKGEEAFLDPEMAWLEAGLRLVPSNSLDATSAQELLARIKTGRAQAMARRRQSEQAQARAPVPPPVPSAPEPERRPPPVQPEPPAAQAQAGAPPPPSPPSQLPSPSPEALETSEKEVDEEAALAEEKARQQAAEEKARQEEASWRGRFREAHSRIEQIQRQIHEAQRGREVNGLPVTAALSLHCDPDEQTCSQYETYSEDTRRSELEQLKGQLTQAESALADLEREASARSVPREWRQ